MTPWTERQYGQCAYLLTRSEACCAPVARGSAMADRYCTEHYNLMIDRDGMRRMAAKRGVGRAATENTAVGLTRHERLDEYRALRAYGPRQKYSTVWDDAREGKK